MSSFHPFLLRIHWGGKFSYANGVVSSDESTRFSSFPIRHKISYEELVDIVYNHVGIQKSSFKVDLLLSYRYEGISEASYIVGDGSLEMLYYLAETQENFRGDIYVTYEPIISVEQTGCMELLRSVSVSEAPQQTIPFYESGNVIQSRDFQAGTSTSIAVEGISYQQLHDAGHEDGNDVFDNSDYHSSEASEDAGEDLSLSTDETDDDGYDEPAEEYNVGIVQEFAQGPVHYPEDAGELRDFEAPGFEEDDYMDIWNEESNEIRVGMYFKSKNDVIYAVRRWNVSRNREIAVVESRPSKWRARCHTTSSGYTNRLPNASPCNWYVFARKNRNEHMWRISRWVPSHNCYGSVVRNNNRSLTSKAIATYINHAICMDITYPVKQIQAYCKDTLKVDVSYIKAWRARRVAVDNIYGNWESNFDDLPKYIAALEDSNPNTVVQWLHQTDGSSQYATFKYVFWAFGPSIEAFQLCRPVISVDGTHLKGSYRGKMLIAVTKDANNYILPVAYAIVDEETVESWSWFFQQFRMYIANRSTRVLCVISDRHRGIIHAMNNLDEWKEPYAYHRFCLRHVRSNFMKRFKSMALKRLCWSVGSTVQGRKYRNCIREMKNINPDAWEYLKTIGGDKWTVYHDNGHRRWGNLTTNISESLNNALRGARLLPIKACIEYTFNKAVQQFRKHTEIARSCNTPLPPRVWRIFNERDIHAQEHTITEFNYDQALYKVTSKIQTNEHGGNDYTVEYDRKKCTCRKWQMQRFPCSHAIAVCRNRGLTPHSIVHKVYKTATYRQQYTSDFYPLAHPANWRDPGWRIKADPLKIIASRGRRRARRFRNEMDSHHPDEPMTRRCSICRETGHNMLRCPNSHP